MDADKMKKKFAENFRKALEDSSFKGLPLEKLGKIFGVSGAMVHYWTDGQKMPSMARAALVAIKLAVNIEWLLTNRGPMRIKEGISYQGASLLSAFEGMGPDARREILAHAAFVADRHGDKLTSKELSSLAESTQQDPARPN